MFGEVNSIVAVAAQSPPVNTSAPYSTDSLRGETIVVTGGASGFGAGFAEAWATAGAQVIIGDINDEAGRKIVDTLNRTTTDIHRFFHCDVTSWESQAAFFRQAHDAAISGGIDAIVPNAGIAEKENPVRGNGFEVAAADTSYTGPGIADPLPPNLAVVNVNITGVLYTVHLGFYWMAQNPAPKDKHILLISSIGGLVGLPGQALYSTSKHAVTGLFRTMRASSALVNNGLRINMLCPYFVETGILPAAAKLLLAGGGKAAVDDVVDAGTRLMADHSIVGRALAIGPRVLVSRNSNSSSSGGGGGGGDGDETTVAADLTREDAQFAGLPKATATGPNGQAVWDCYAQDLESCEIFVWRFIKMLNVMTVFRGWLGFFSDILSVFQTKPVLKRKMV